MEQQSRRSSGKKTREAILDAAEEVFARKGYHGATVREIFQLANANTGLMQYYFSTKERLYEQTLARRMDEMFDAVSSALDALSGKSGRAADAEAICFTYIHTLLGLSSLRDRGWSNYMRLLANSTSVYDEYPIGDLLARFDPLVTRTLAMLKEAIPDAAPEQVERNFYFLEACITTTMLSDRLRSHRLHDGSPPDITTLAREMARVFSRAMCAVH